MPNPEQVLAPARPGKVICCGLNYGDHIAELGRAVGARLAEPHAPVVPGQAWDATTLVFDCPSLLAYISTFTVLRPGDVVLTGTPGGVGPGMTPPTFLEDGDVIETEVAGIGTLTNTVRFTT